MKLTIVLLFVMLFAGCELTTERVPDNLVAKDLQKDMESNLMNGATGDGMFVDQNAYIVCSDELCEMDCNEDTKLDCTDIECQKSSASTATLVQLLLDNDINCPQQ
ncbi:MAG TPA: hypothetical protein PK443_03560 [bacterium]|nr:hypothetical protein [bacterium]